MEEEDEFSEDLLCPICLHLPPDEIYQCSNGHSVCSKCCESTDICAHCRVSWKEGKIRNRAMESFIGSLKCSCPYKSLGCEQDLQRKDLQNHKQACIYNGRSIQSCKLLGFNCNFWTSGLSIDTAIGHFVEEHEFIVRKDCTALINLDDFLGATMSNDGENLKDLMWTPVLMEYKYKADDEKSEDSDTESDSWSTNSDSSQESLLLTQKFVIVTRLHGEDRTMSWQGIFLGESNEAALQFEIQFEIKSHSDKVPDLKWKVPSVAMLQGEVMTMQMSPFRVPISLLSRYYLENTTDQDLVIKVNIAKEGDTKSVLDEVDDDPVPVYTFSFALDTNSKGCACICKECRGTSHQILFKCRSCEQPYYVCDQCIETCAHPADHSFDVVKGLENPESCEDRVVFENARSPNKAGNKDEKECNHQ